MRLFLAIIFGVVSSSISAQIVVTDINLKPIPFVEVLSNNKHFYAETNLKGELNWGDLEKLKPSDTLFFNLVSFERIFFLKKNLSPNDTIQLNQRIQELETFTVNTNPKKYNYQKIDFCYRSYQFNDDSVAFYMDGKGAYVSKLNKDNVNLLIQESRSFANQVVEDEFQPRSVQITWLPSVPRPPFRFLPFQVGKQKKSNNQARIETNDSYITYTLEDKDFIGTNHFAKTEINRVRHQVILVFRNYEGLDVSSINDFDNLIYYKSIREYKTKHDKEKKTTKILQVSEMFVEDVQYLETVNKKDYNSSRVMRKKSKYTTEFWKACACELFEVPNKYLLRNLYQR